MNNFDDIVLYGTDFDYPDAVEEIARFHDIDKSLRDIVRDETQLYRSKNGLTFTKKIKINGEEFNYKYDIVYATIPYEWSSTGVLVVSLRELIQIKLDMDFVDMIYEHL